jgi:hypothetical protein
VFGEMPVYDRAEFEIAIHNCPILSIA